MQNDKESPFTLTLLDDDLSFQVVQFSGREALNQPYRFDIEIIGLAPAMNLDRLLQQPVFLSMGHDLGFHGVLHSASREHRGTQRVGYKLVLSPYLQALERRSRRRVFHRLSVPMILRQLLEEHDLPVESYRFELANGQYPQRPFCIQYDESDLALLQRLCEEEGIHYHFEHQRHGHVLVLADDCMSFPQEPLPTPFHGDECEDSVLPSISELYQRHDSPPSPLRMEARNRGMQNAGDSAANHSFVGPSPMMTRPDPEQLHRDQRSRRQLERLRCQHLKIHGQSNHREMRSARIAQVEGHPLTSFNDQWLLTEIRHQGQQHSILDEDKPGRVQRYHNRFTAIAWSTVFRPPLEQVRPSIPGYQPARVLGAVGQPAAQDDQGRIQVRLWPTEQTGPDESDGIWLPVVLATTDGRTALSRMPTGGTDVLISFLDSDPDRPVLCAGPSHPPSPRPTREPRSDTHLLLDWLVNRTDLTP